MPRAFSTLEKENIRRALIQAAAAEITAKGIRKLSIDSLVRAVHISKGAFYLFYSSKEMLIFDVLRDIQESARNEIWGVINQKPAGAEDDAARRLLEGLFLVFSKYPVFAELSKPGSMTELVRGLPQEVLDAEFASDEEFFQSLFVELVKEKQLRDVSVSVLCGLPRMVLVLETNKEMIGLDRYEELRAMLISGMAHELGSG